jgi:hypothetical protein
MPDIHHRLVMSASREEVFSALTAAVTSRVSEAGAFVRTLVFERGARAVWRCVDGPSDWVGTEISIELTGEGDGTIVRFAHRDFQEVTDVLASCATRWARILLGLQTFVAIPEPDDTRV